MVCFCFASSGDNVSDSKYLSGNFRRHSTKRRNRLLSIPELWVAGSVFSANSTFAAESTCCWPSLSNWRNDSTSLYSFSRCRAATPSRKDGSCVAFIRSSARLRLTRELGTIEDNTTLVTPALRKRIFCKRATSVTRHLRNTRFLRMPKYSSLVNTLHKMVLSIADRPCFWGRSEDCCCGFELTTAFFLVRSTMDSHPSLDSMRGRISR
mmetsp:Transcript_117694/g.332990  ORF Transcript_117694/g.332990 Transcript_117694/m.332990 type:complete len:209 (-) Transcript_117694:1032-1658(-)